MPLVSDMLIVHQLIVMAFLVCLLLGVIAFVDRVIAFFDWAIGGPDWRRRQKLREDLDELAALRAAARLAADDSHVSHAEAVNVMADQSADVCVKALERALETMQSDPKLARREVEYVVEVLEKAERLDDVDYVEVA